MKVKNFLLLIILAIFLITPYTIDAQKPKILYVYTDPPDLEYLREIEYTVDLIADGDFEKADLSKYNVLAIVDPNPVNPFSEETTRKIFDFVGSGKVLILGYNGLVNLNRIVLREVGLTYELINNITSLEIQCNDHIESYNVSLYKFLMVTTHLESRIVCSSHNGYPIVTLVKLGKGLIVIIHINPIWAFYDSKNEIYANILNSIIEELSFRFKEETSIRQQASIIIASISLIGFSAFAQGGQALKLLPRGRTRYFTILIPLFSKLSKKDIFENKIRTEIYETIVSEKIVSVSDLQKTLGISRATLEWHLFVLERLGFISTIKFFGKKYAYNTKFEEEILISFIRSKSKLKKALTPLATYKRISLIELLGKSKISFEGIRDFLQHLCKLGIIMCEISVDGTIYATDKGVAWLKEVIGDVDR